MNERLNAATIRRLANRPHGIQIVLVNKSNSNTIGVYDDYKKAVEVYHAAGVPVLITGTSSPAW